MVAEFKSHVLSRDEKGFMGVPFKRLMLVGVGGGIVYTLGKFALPDVAIPVALAAAALQRAGEPDAWRSAAAAQPHRERRQAGRNPDRSGAAGCGNTVHATRRLGRGESRRMDHVCPGRRCRSWRWAGIRGGALNGP